MSTVLCQDLYTESVLKVPGYIIIRVYLATLIVIDKDIHIYHNNMTIIIILWIKKVMMC